MPESEKIVCPTCKGAGYLYDEASATREPCNCKIAEYMIRHLGAEIAKAETIYSSPLVELPVKNGETPRLDRTKENLRIKCVWSDLLPHLKLCLWPKGIFFNFRVVTDEKIKTVYVGAEAYNARSKGKRDDVVTYNSLGDLLGTEYEFVVIRLGHLGHKNIAAAGALKEALMIRDVARKPTWIVEEPHSPFDPSCFSYSDDLAEYIDRNFKPVNLRRADAPHSFEPTGFRSPVEVVGGVQDVTLAAPAPRPVRTRVEAPTPSDEGLPGEGRESRYRGGKYRKGGGGPL